MESAIVIDKAAIIPLKEQGGRRVITLHHGFLVAPEDVLVKIIILLIFAFVDDKMHGIFVLLAKVLKKYMLLVFSNSSINRTGRFISKLAANKASISSN